MIKFPKQFYTKPALLFLVILPLVLFVIIQIGAAISFHASKQRIQSAELDRLAQIANRPADQKAVENAQSYLKTNIARTDPATRLVLDYVQRKFSLDTGINKDAYPINTTLGGVTASEEIEYILRIAYPDKIHRIPPKNISNPIMLTNIYSANCDHLNSPAIFWKTIKDNVDKGGYYLTHNALAFAMLKDNNCELPQDITDLKPLVFSKMSRIIEDENTVPDLRYEAIALLMLNGRHEQIKSSWIDQIIKEQQSDGSWTAKPGDTDNQPHATLLAMWAILEYKNPDKPYEPLIRHVSR